MTRKHFEALAAVLRDARSYVDRVQPSAEQTVDYIARSLALACEGTNPHFDRGRFLTATLRRRAGD